MNITLFGDLDLNKDYKFYKVGGVMPYSFTAIASILNENPQRSQDELLAIRTKNAEWGQSAFKFYALQPPPGPFSPKSVGNAAEMSEIKAAVEETLAALDRTIAHPRLPETKEKHEEDYKETKLPWGMIAAGAAVLLMLKG